MAAVLTSIAWRGLILISSLCLCFPATATTQDIDACSKALIYNRSIKTSTYSSRISRLLNVSEETWRVLKSSASGSAVYEGVPIGATYSEFEQNVRRFAMTLKVDASYSGSSTKITEELSEASFKAFTRCMEIASSETRIAVRFDPSGDTLTVYYHYRTYNLGSPFKPTITLRGEGIQWGDALNSAKATFEATEIGRVHREDLSITIPLNDPEKELEVTIRGKELETPKNAIWSGIPPLHLKQTTDVTKVAPIVMESGIASQNKVFIKAPSSTYIFPDTPIVLLTGKAYAAGSDLEIADGSLKLTYMGAARVHPDVVETTYKAEQIAHQSRWDVVLNMSVRANLSYRDNLIGRDKIADRDIRICQTKMDRDRNNAKTASAYEPCIEGNLIFIETDSIKTLPPSSMREPPSFVREPPR
jgi:hypothetical protein